MSQYISATEKIYRELAQPKAPQPQPARVTEAKPITLTRADVDEIIQHSRGASPEELEYAITHAKDLILTDGERNQLGCDLSIAVAQRARQVNGRREAPGANFIHDVLNLTETPHGYIERGWFANLLRSNAASIARCKNHRPPRCSCWSGAREALWQAAHTHGDKSPEAWAALQVWEILEELELTPRTRY